ncbi:MAG: 50S ribosomal protein L24 [Deltaproteobacteria bacterium]|jgi:large subunit ribosomal protein L24|nr:50S ribosomal protein L24 [Deltaproteobacteria bacterium]
MSKESKSANNRPYSTEFKAGDRLFVLSGPNKGKIGLFKRFFPKKGFILVEGVNLGVKHAKSNPNLGVAGGRIKKEKPLHVSNVALVCPKCADPTWIRHEILPGATDDDKKRKVRVCKVCQARIDE